MFYRLLIFTIIVFIITIFQKGISLADNPGVHNISVRINLSPISEEKFMEFISVIERRISEAGTITSLNINKELIELSIRTELTPERLKYILSKKGIFSVKDEKENKTELKIKYAFFDTETNFSPELKVSLSKNSSEDFAKITEKNIKKKLSSYLDDQLLYSPVVMEKISDGELVITFGYDKPDYYPQDVAIILRNPLPEGVIITDLTLSE